MTSPAPTPAALVAALAPVTSRVRTDVTAIKLPDGSRWTREPLTHDRLLAHVSGGLPRGVCPIREGETTTSVIVIDFDSHKGETAWDEMLACARQVADTMQLFGLAPTAWRSSGGRGVHLYLLWAEPQDAYSAREAVREVLAACGLRDGAAGVARGQVEVYPRQDEVGLGEFGNQFILPLAGASVPLDLDLGMVLDRAAALALPWPCSEPVPVRERPVRQASAADGADPIEKVSAALHRVPTADLDYFAWHKLVCAVHEATGGSEEGLDLVLDWSSSHDRHDEKFVRDRVWPYVKDARSGATATRASLYGKAAEYGWSLGPVPSAEGFTDALPALTGAAEAAAEDGGGADTEDEQDETELPPLQRTTKGVPVNTMTNIVAACRSKLACGFRIGYDSFRDEIMCRTGGALSWRPFKDADYTRIRVKLERIGFEGVAKEHVRDAVELVAHEGAFDSAMLWLDSLPWDGTSRVETWLQRYFGVADSPYARAVSLYTWTALAGRVMAPGCQADMVPILVGDQGLGKTSAVRVMVPSMEYFASVNFHEQDDNLARKMRGKLIAEFGELRGFRTREIESIKDFVSRTHEEWVPKYKEFGSKFARRLLFVGTTNQDQFLADDTGNRRWLPVRVGRVDVEALRRDAEQLWAEGRALWASTGVQWREAEQLAKAEHEAYSISDPWDEKVSAWLDSADIDGEPVKERYHLTTEMVLAEALRMDATRTQKGDQMRAAGVLKRLGYSRTTKRVDGALKKVWEVTTVTTSFPPATV